jgi:hypothetical protein
MRRHWASWCMIRWRATCFTPNNLCSLVSIGVLQFMKDTGSARNYACFDNSESVKLPLQEVKSTIRLLSYPDFLVFMVRQSGQSFQIQEHFAPGGWGKWREAEVATQPIKALNVMESTMAAHSLLHGVSLVQMGQHGPSARQGPCDNERGGVHGQRVAHAAPPPNPGGAQPRRLH